MYLHYLTLLLALSIIDIFTMEQNKMMLTSKDILSDFKPKRPCGKTNDALPLCRRSSCKIQTGMFSVPNINLLFLEVTMTISEGRLLFGTRNTESETEYFYKPDTSVNFERFVEMKFVLPIDPKRYTNGISLSVTAEPSTCGSVTDMELFYYNCPNTGQDRLANFKVKNAPTKDKIDTTIGICIENAIPRVSNEPRRECMYNGTYEYIGECVCNVDYERIQNKCEECGDMFFKAEPANDEKCKLCGDHSSKNGSEHCKCDDGYFRGQSAELSKKDMPCYAPPSKPTNLAFTAKSTEVTVTWDAPSPGSNPSGVYVIECNQCRRGLTFDKVEVETTKATLKGLGAYTEYSITITKKNNITSLTGMSFPVQYQIKTKIGVPGRIQDVTMKTENDGTAVFKWGLPLPLGGPRIAYRIKYGSKSFQTSWQTFKIPPSDEKETYTVEITAVVLFDSKEYVGTDKHVDSVTVGRIISEEDSSIPIAMIAGISAAIFVLLLIVLFVVLKWWKHKHLSHLEVYRMEDGSVLQKNSLFNNARLYVDPTTYSVVDDAVYEFTEELCHSNLSIANLIGTGEFADVYKAVLSKSGINTNVAVKMLKTNASDKDREDFVSEAALLGQFSDQNVISLEGVILKDFPNVIILEYMSNGSLDIYLQENTNQFSIITLLGMARGVASGMKYLSGLGYIHRDIAARNVLVNKQDVCKIADFGMSRELKTDETYDTRGGKIPIKWTAPEAIEFKKFTTASDVWSYGILVWEIMSYGIRPYWNWANYDVLERLATGYRLPPPTDCPKVVHDLMLQCWHKDRMKRPKFPAIQESVEEWIRYPDLLRDIASVVDKSDENIDYSAIKTIADWLESIKMEQYTPNFENHKFFSPKDIFRLTNDDLEELGVNLIGHRKKLLKAIKKTKQQVDKKKSSRSSSISRRDSRSASFTSFAKRISMYGKGGHLNNGYEKNTLNEPSNNLNVYSQSCF